MALQLSGAACRQKRQLQDTRKPRNMTAALCSVLRVRAEKLWRDLTVRKGSCWVSCCYIWHVPDYRHDGKIIAHALLLAGKNRMNHCFKSSSSHFWTKKCQQHLPNKWAKQLQDIQHLKIHYTLPIIAVTPVDLG